MNSWKTKIQIKNNEKYSSNISNTTLINPWLHYRDHHLHSGDKDPPAAFGITDSIHRLMAGHQQPLLMESEILKNIEESNLTRFQMLPPHQSKRRQIKTLMQRQPLNHLLDLKVSRPGVPSLPFLEDALKLMHHKSFVGAFLFLFSCAKCCIATLIVRCSFQARIIIT